MFIVVQLELMNDVISLCHWKDHVNVILVNFYRRETGVSPLIKSEDSGLGTLAEIRYNGRIKLAVPTILSISCIMDMTMYPFDIQRCNLIFGECDSSFAFFDSSLFQLIISYEKLVS